MKLDSTRETLRHELMSPLPASTPPEDISFNFSTKPKNGMQIGFVKFNHDIYLVMFISEQNLSLYEYLGRVPT